MLGLEQNSDSHMSFIINKRYVEPAAEAEFYSTHTIFIIIKRNVEPAVAEFYSTHTFLL
jgi:hypothetical protein